jgi:hypothetical protein
MVGEILLALTIALIGILLIVGATRRWEWLVNPPTALWFCYSQSLLKAIGGAEFCRLATLAIGYAFIATSLMFVGTSLFLPRPGP